MGWTQHENGRTYYLHRYAFFNLVYGFCNLQTIERDYAGDSRQSYQLTPYPLWADFIANMLGQDTEDVFGLVFDALPFGQCYGRRIQAVIEDDEGFLSAQNLDREKIFNSIRKKNSLHENEPVSWDQLNDFAFSNVGPHLSGVFYDPAYTNAQEEAVLSEKIKEAVQRVISCLSEHQAHILRERFGLNARRQSRTLEDIAGDYGCTKENIRKHEENALKRLREGGYKLSPHIRDLEDLMFD